MTKPIMSRELGDVVNTAVSFSSPLAIVQTFGMLIKTAAKSTNRLILLIKISGYEEQIKLIISIVLSILIRLRINFAYLQNGIHRHEDWDPSMVTQSSHAYQTSKVTCRG